MGLPELKVVPAGKVETNFAEIKAFVEGRVAFYDGLVYTEDQIPDAKKDRTELNDLSKSLNRARIDSKKVYMQGFKDFEEEAKKLTQMVDDASAGIGNQIAAFEEKQRAEKLEAIKELFTEKKFPEGVIFAHIFDQRWLNKKPELKNISAMMDERKKQIMDDIATLNSFTEYQGESLSVYFQRLDLNAAMRFHEEKVQHDREMEAQRRQEELRRQQEEQERQQAELRRRQEELDRQEEELRRRQAALAQPKAQRPVPFTPVPFMEAPAANMPAEFDELPAPAVEDMTDEEIEAALSEIFADAAPKTAPRKRYIIRAELDAFEVNQVKMLLNQMEVSYEMEEK